MFYEIEYKSQFAINRFVFNKNDIWIPKLKYSLNKRKRWSILDCIYYQNDILNHKFILTITNINNNNGILFGIFNKEQIIVDNHHRHFELDKNSFCKSNKKGFINIKSLENDMYSIFDHKKEKKNVKKPKFSKRKQHRNLKIDNSNQYIDLFENNYNPDEDLNGFDRFNITIDSIGISNKPKKIKSNKQKLRKLNKKLLEYEIKDSLDDYYSDKEYEVNLKIQKKKNQDGIKQNQYNQDSLPNVFLSEVIFENDSRNEIPVHTRIPERDRPYTSMELQILVGDALSSAFIQLFEERPRDPINQLAKILYSMANELENSSNLLDSQMDTVSNLP